MTVYVTVKRYRKVQRQKNQAKMRVGGMEAILYINSLNMGFSD